MSSEPSISPESSSSPPPSSSPSSLSGPIICPGHSRPVPDISFTSLTPDGYFLISACLDNKAMLRDGSTGDWIGTFLGHKGAVWCARLNSTATQAVTGAADFSAMLWNACTGDVIHTFPHKHIVKTTVFSRDNSQIFTGGQEKKLRVFDLNAPETAKLILENAHSSSISSIVPIPSTPHTIVSCAAEKGLKVWDLRTSKCERTIETTSDCSSMQLSIDGSTISVSAGKQVQLYSASSLSLLHSFNFDRDINSVSYSPLFHRFVCSSESELWVRAYDASTSEEIACNKGHHGPVKSLAFAPDQTTYASGSVDGTIRIWSWAGSGVSSTTEKKE